MYTKYFRPTLRLRTYSPDEYHGGVIANDTITCNDLVTVPGAYGWDTFKNLFKELKECNEKYNEKIFIPWHKNNHLIANDKFMGGRWKDECVLLKSLVDDMCKSFNVTPNATRVNIYCRGEDGFKSDIKPFHHDRASFTPGLTQNITLGLSLGATREIGFKYAKYKAEPSSKWVNVPKNIPPVITSVPCRNGSVYAFARDVNCEFQHGVIPEAPHVCGIGVKDRISIIVWGTKYDLNIDDSRVSHNQMPTPSELGVKRRPHNRRK